MSKNKAILLFLSFASVVLLYITTPKDKYKNGIVAFLFKQVITWLFGLLVVEKGLIRYPDRFFKKSNRTSFSFEYLIYPAFCAMFNLHYPESKNRFIKLLYYVFHSGFITVAEVIAERYTNIIKYVKWKWYWSFLTIGVTNFISRQFYRWFFKSEFNS